MNSIKQEVYYLLSLTVIVDQSIMLLTNVNVILCLLSGQLVDRFTNNSSRSTSKLNLPVKTDKTATKY